MLVTYTSLFIGDFLVNEELNGRVEACTAENEELKLRVPYRKGIVGGIFLKCQIIQVEELVAVEHKYQCLKDEVDELRSGAEEAKKIESALETYRKKTGNVR